MAESDQPKSIVSIFEDGRFLDDDRITEVLATVSATKEMVEADEKFQAVDASIAQRRQFLLDLLADVVGSSDAVSSLMSDLLHAAEEEDTIETAKAAFLAGYAWGAQAGATNALSKDAVSAFAAAAKVASSRRKGGMARAILSAGDWEEHVRPAIAALVNEGLSAKRAIESRVGPQLRTGKLISGRPIDIGDAAIQKRWTNRSSGPQHGNA